MGALGPGVAAPACWKEDEAGRCRDAAPEAFPRGGVYDTSLPLYLLSDSSAEMSPLRKHVNSVVNLSINILAFHALI